MAIIRKSVRSAATAVAGVFIGLSLLGMGGVWWLDHRAAEITRKAFGVVQTAVGVVDAGVGRVDDLIAGSRTEARQAAETITAVGPRAQANRPVLIALNDRLETSLVARVAQMRERLAPVRDAVATTGDVVSLLNSVPGMAERAPRLAALDETFQRLEGLSADAGQLRGTLRELVTSQADEVSPEAVAAPNDLTKRIDGRLGEVQAGVQAVRADIDALQLRLDRRKSRVLLLFNLLTLAAMLMLAWVLYSQVVVIRHLPRLCDKQPEATGVPEALPIVRPPE